MTNGTAKLADRELLEIAKEVTEEAVMQAVSLLKPKHIYTTKSGVALELRPVSSVLINRLNRDTFGKPQPPIVESLVGPQKRKVREANPEDPEYKAALDEWERDQNEKKLRYIFARGIANSPSPEDIKRLSFFFPGDNADGIKFAWLLEVTAEDEDEITDLVRAITGQTVPTEKGISEAEQRFRGDGERQSDQELSATED